jgi:ubiquitin carboxyl-terminal hydrolase 4/11/15
MNACMQCLISLPELNYYFSNELYKVKKSTPACNALKEFIETYSNANSSLKACSSLYKICHSFLPANEQNDCQEFLRRFLSKIQEELSTNKKYSFPDKESFDKVWQIYREYNPSFIDTLFSGLMRSSVICNKCGYKSGKSDLLI